MSFSAPFSPLIPEFCLQAAWPRVWMGAEIQPELSNQTWDQAGPAWKLWHVCSLLICEREASFSTWHKDAVCARGFPDTYVGPPSFFQLKTTLIQIAFKELRNNKAR